MRAALLALTLVVVGAASALNLALGGLWVAAFLGIAVLRRRVRAAAVLVFLGAIGVAALARWGGVAPPRATSYEVDEVAWVRSRLPGVGHPGLGEDGPGGAPMSSTTANAPIRSAVPAASSSSGTPSTTSPTRSGPGARSTGVGIVSGTPSGLRWMAESRPTGIPSGVTAPLGARE